MNGLSAACLTTVNDSHYVASDTLQGYAPILREVLGVQNVNMDEIWKFKSFKSVLKEVNSRDHNIYN